jgi:hypothetical protein
MGTWESFGTLKTLELDCRGQNTSPWSFFHIIGKLPKCRCQKWPHMSHLDIYNISYGQKKFLTTKSRESTRPHCVQGERDTQFESSQGEVQVCFRPHPNRRSGQKTMISQSPGSLNRDSFETPLWESQDKKSFGCGCSGVTHKILYGGRWWLPLSSGRGESCESRVARGLS